MRLARTIALILLLMAAAILVLQKPAFRTGPQPESPQPVCDSLDELARIQSLLSEIPLETESVEPGEVPLHAAAYLTRTKMLVRTLVASLLRADPGLAEGPDVLRTLTVAHLASAGLGLVRDTPRHYGDLREISLQRSPLNPDVLTAALDIAIECGQDSSLFVFERRQAAWPLVAVAESNGYGKISEAQGSLQFGVSPRNADGTYFVVTNDISPWCTSAWQLGRTRVLVPANDPEKPSELLFRSDSVFMGDVDSPGFFLSPGAFSFTFRVSQSLDSGMHNRDRILSYRIKRSLAERVPPFASDPAGFLDEWAGFPWEQASRFTLPPAQESAQNLHRRLHQAERGFFSEFGAIERCTGEEERWHLRLDLEPDTGGGNGKEALFFEVSKNGDAYAVAAAGPEPSPGCTVLEKVR